MINTRGGLKIAAPTVFRLNIQPLFGGKNVAALQIYDSYGWELMGLGFNTGGSWRWQNSLMGTKLILDNKQARPGNLPFAILSGKWSWGLFAPPAPWFSRSGVNKGSIEMSALAKSLLYEWVLA